MVVSLYRKIAKIERSSWKQNEQNANRDRHRTMLFLSNRKTTRYNFNFYGKLIVLLLHVIGMSQHFLAFIFCKIIKKNSKIFQMHTFQLFKLLTCFRLLKIVHQLNCSVRSFWSPRERESCGRVCTHNLIKCYERTINILS